MDQLKFMMEIDLLVLFRSEKYDFIYNRLDIL